MQITGSYVDWHQGQSRERDERERLARIARYEADPQTYLRRRKEAGLPAVPPVGARVITPPVVVEPSPADLAEMRREQLTSELETFCRNFKLEQRRAFMAEWNLRFQRHRMGMRIKAWKAYE